MNQLGNTSEAATVNPAPVPDAGAGGAGGSEGDRWLDRFPEALEAAAGPEPAARQGASVLVYMVLFYAGMAVGVFAALSLIAAVFFQGWVATNFIQLGGDYLGSGPEAQAAREVMGIPLGGFVVALLAGFAALSTGAVGVLRRRRKSDTNWHSP